MVEKEEEAAKEERSVEEEVEEDGLVRIGTLSAEMEINKCTSHSVSIHKGLCVWFVCMYVIVQTSHEN